MNVLVCPGIHASEWTQAFLAQVGAAIASPHRPKNHPDRPNTTPPLHWWVLPPEVPPYAPQPVADFFESCWTGVSALGPAFDPQAPLVWLGFSAGVVGAIATARAWQRRGRPTAALIAFDGWGVPLTGDFSLYRFSHDRFTAQTSEWPQASAGVFYAEPAVPHLDLWRSPSTAGGFWQTRGGEGDRHFTTALEALVKLLEQLGNAGRL